MVIVRPNLNQVLPRNTVPVSDPIPLMHIRLPPLSPPHSLATDTQKSLPSFTKPYNVAASRKTPDITSVFLDQMRDLKSQMLQMQQTQNFLLKNIMSQPPYQPRKYTNFKHKCFKQYIPKSFLHVSLSFHEYSSPNQ